MNNNRTDQFAYSLARYFCYAFALRKDDVDGVGGGVNGVGAGAGAGKDEEVDGEWNPDYTIGVLEGVQKGSVGYQFFLSNHSIRFDSIRRPSSVSSTFLLPLYLLTSFVLRDTDFVVGFGLCSSLRSF